MEELHEIANEFRIRIGQQQDAEILKRLKAINKEHLIDECKRKKLFKPITHVTIQGTNKTQIWIDDNSNLGQLLVTFDIDFSGLVPVLIIED